MNRDYALMNTLSAWTVALRCPHCGHTGSGTVSEDAHGGQRERRLRMDVSSGFVSWNCEPAPGKLFDAGLAIAPR
jgi:hypothetical protein